MNKYSRLLLYIMGSVFFVISFIEMIIYWYRTFYIEKEYAYNFALIVEQEDNEYRRLIEQGVNKYADENNIYLEYVAPPKARDTPRKSIPP